MGAVSPSPAVPGRDLRTSKTSALPPGVE